MLGDGAPAMSRPGSQGCDPASRVGADDQRYAVRGSPGGELIVWREIAERERARAEAAEAQAVELRVTLAGIAQAGPIRALRLRRALRSIPAGDPIARPVRRGLERLRTRCGRANRPPERAPRPERAADAWPRRSPVSATAHVSAPRRVPWRR